MDFGLSDEQKLLAETVRRYVAEQCPTTRVRTIMESEDGHDRALWQGLMELGIGSIVASEEDGGLGGEFLDLALISEELGYGCVPGPFIGHAMATIALAASAERSADIRSLLEGAMSGQQLGTVAIGDGGGRWDTAELTTTISGDTLSAEKPLVPYAREADFLIVAGRDDDGAGLWLVRGSAAGISTEALQGNDHTRRLFSVSMKDAACTKLGGDELFARVRDAGLILVAADAFGGSRRCLDMAREYALTREQFGQVIGQFQAVKHTLADLASELEPAMSLYWYAAHALDFIPEEAPAHAAMAKALITDLFDRAARDSTEVHGGIGFTWEFDLHLWFRRSMFDRSFLGDAGHHRARAADIKGW